MKLLKLDARFEDARRVARCLVGSQVYSTCKGAHDVFVGTFISVSPSAPFSFICQDIELDRNMLPKYSLRVESIFHIDTLKFCPHSAAKHQVQVRGLQKGILHFGVIRKIAFAKAGPRFRIDSMGGHAMMFRKSSISLNLIQIERGELEGCEIVEVGE